MIAVRRKGVTNVDEKASGPERIFPRIISLADTTRTCVCGDRVRVEKQENTTQEHLFVAFRTVTRVKGKRSMVAHVAFFYV